MSSVPTVISGLAFALSVFAAAPALAAPLSSMSSAISGASGLTVLVEKKKGIDESCLMVCVKWVGDNCEKFEMKCKGDAGYPTANQATQGTTSGTTGTADPGSTGNQGIKGRPNVMDNAKTKGN